MKFSLFKQLYYIYKVPLMVCVCMLKIAIKYEIKYMNVLLFVLFLFMILVA